MSFEHVDTDLPPPLTEQEWAEHDAAIAVASEADGARPAARIIDVSPTAYHRLPGFSSSLAKVLLRQSVAHARDKYEEQQERAEADDDSDGDADMTDEKRKQLERGSVLHALILGKGKRVAIAPQEILGSNGAWSTKESKAFRAAARARGDIPVKQKTADGYVATATALVQGLAARGHVLDGTSELAVEWTERPELERGPQHVLCRGMMDHVRLFDADGHVIPATPDARPVRAIVYDVKINADASPDMQSRVAERLGYAVQAAAYRRALAALYPSLQGRIEFRFLFLEPRRPFAIWDPQLSGAFAEIGQRRWWRAVTAWGRGLATGEWPVFEADVLDVPAWALREEGYADGEEV